MSEDEDEAAAAAQQQRRQQRPAGSAQAAQPSALTRDFFSSILASVTQQQQQQQQSQPNRDFFQNAFQQAMNETASTNRPQPATVSAPQPSLSDADIAQKLEQMHECGLLDDERNLRALQLANGNVEAAVAILFEGMEFE